MHKPVWASIAGDDHKIPEGATLPYLTRTLFSYLSSSDPVLRDDIAYNTCANWLKREMYTKEEVGGHVQELLAVEGEILSHGRLKEIFLQALQHVKPD